MNKIDLIPHLEADVDRLLYNIRAVNPAALTMLLSARTGEGVDAFNDWLSSVHARAELVS